MNNKIREILLSVDDKTSINTIYYNNKRNVINSKEFNELRLSFTNFIYSIPNFKLYENYNTNNKVYLCNISGAIGVNPYILFMEENIGDPRSNLSKIYLPKEYHNKLTKINTVVTLNSDKYCFPTEILINYLIEKDNRNIFLKGDLRLFKKLQEDYINYIILLCDDATECENFRRVLTNITTFGELIDIYPNIYKILDKKYDISYKLEKETFKSRSMNELLLDLKDLI